MTLVVALITPRYAAVLADSRSIVRGPALIPLGGTPLMTSCVYRVDDSDNLVLEEGQSLVVDGPHPSLAKVRFSSDLGEAFSFAGSREASEPYLGLRDPVVGLEADEQIAEHLKKKAALHQVLEIPPGEYDSWDAMHVFVGSGRYVAVKFEASPLHFCRWYTRSSQEGVRYVAIGSGSRHIDSLLKEPPLAKAWATLATRIDDIDRDEIVRFWVPLFKAVSQREQDINALVRVWVRDGTSNSFQYRGDHTADFDLARKAFGK